MSKYKLILQEEAILDLHYTFKYYESKKIGLGDQFEGKVFDILNLIESNPFLFQIRFGNYREAPLNNFPYNVIYEILEDTIVVNAVFFTKKHPAKKNRKMRK